jgi:hypothetical protein
MVKPVEQIPIFVGGVHLFDYWVGELFSKWGNEDGNDTRLEAVSWRVVSEIERAGFAVETADWSVHNALFATEIRKGAQRWRNRWARSVDDDYPSFWESLPEGVKHIYRRLARRGIDMGNSIHVCLIHDYWNFEGGLCCEHWGVPDGIDHSRYTRKAILRRPIGLDGFLTPRRPLLESVLGGDVKLSKPLTREELAELTALRLKTT